MQSEKEIYNREVRQIYCETPSFDLLIFLYVRVRFLAGGQKEMSSSTRLGLGCCSYDASTGFVYGMRWRGGGGVAGFQPMSSAAHLEPK